MVQINKYIVDGKVKRDRIVADVKRGRLSVEDINQLDNNETIRTSYFGDNSSIKDIKEWNEKYLDELSLAAVSEVFNKAYLVKLHEVADYVMGCEKKKEKIGNIVKKCIRGLAVVAIIALVIKLMN